MFSSSRALGTGTNLLDRGTAGRPRRGQYPVAVAGRWRPGARRSAAVRTRAAAGDAEVVGHRLAEGDGVDGDAHDRGALGGVSGGLLTAVGVAADRDARRAGPGGDA